MKRRIFALLLSAMMLLGAFTVTASDTLNTDDIVILYENDVHCEIDGYTKIAAIKNELLQTYAHVGVVSSGDFIQGSPYGAISRGGYIVELMNLVGYDALTLGNHEFDYHLPRLEELIGEMNTKPVCCNFQKLDDDESYFKPYSIVPYGDVDIAYVGVTTPSTVTSTSTAQFKDEAGNYIFTFHPDDLYETVQKNIDAALSEGADYVIALSHIGDAEPTYDVKTLIANTTGLDVVLDGHSHSVIEQLVVNDKAGNEVVISSTGTKFEHVGKLTISGGEITTELIKTAEYEATDPAVDACLAAIKEEYALLGNKKIGTSLVHLITHDEEDKRIIRVAETNLGDLCSEAFRSVMNSDIGYINGGGMRSDIAAGELIFNDILSVFPFCNTVVLAKIDGRTFRDMLEMSLYEWPMECSFPHVAGVTFSVNTELETSVKLDENGEFCGVEGEYRVYDIKIFNRETQKYEPMELNKTYTIASNNYYLIDHGSGMTMLENVEVIGNDGTHDFEVLEKYIVEDLGGVIGEEYSKVSPNITFTKGEVIPSDDDDTEPTPPSDDQGEGVQNDEQDDGSLVTIVICSAAALTLAVAAVVTVAVIKKRKAVK